MRPFEAKEPNYILVASGATFVVPAVVSYTHQQYLISILCSLLAMTSVQFHGNPSSLSFYLDQATIACVVWETFWMACRMGMGGGSLLPCF